MSEAGARCGARVLQCQRRGRAQEPTRSLCYHDQVNAALLTGGAVLADGGGDGGWARTSGRTAGGLAERRQQSIIMPGGDVR